MSTPTAGPRELLADQPRLVSQVLALAAQRGKLEPHIRQQHELERDRARVAWEQTQQDLQQRHATEWNQLQADRKAAESRAAADREEALATFKSQANEAQHELQEQLAAEEQKIQAAFQEGQFGVASVFEGSRPIPAQRLQDYQRHVGGLNQRLQTAYQAARTYLAECHFSFNDQTLLQKHLSDPSLQQTAAERSQLKKDFSEESSSTNPQTVEETTQRIQASVAAVEGGFQELRRLSAPTVFRGITLFFIYALLLILVGLPAWLLTGWEPVPLLVGILVISFALGAVLTVLLRIIASRSVQRVYTALCLANSEGLRFIELGLKQMQQSCRAQAQGIQAKADRDLQAIQEKFQPLIQQHQHKAHGRLQALQTQLRQQKQQVINKWEKLVTGAEQATAEAEKALKKQQKQELLDAEAAYRQRVTQADEIFHRQWSELSQQWQAGMEQLQHVGGALVAASSELFPSWDAPWWQEYAGADLNRNDLLPAEVPPVLLTGTFLIDFRQLPGGLPDDESLRKMTPPAGTLPALIKFPEQASLVFRTNANARPVAVQAVQALLLRLLTALPPGKVRLTIFDPVSLGQNFSAFMHLADYNEQLVTNRIWTEAPQIEQRLTDVTAHMENVIQKYLRNQFDTIEQYNAYAGEIAEPYRFVVVCDFPQAFTEASARRLVSIAQSGPRCGVYVLVIADVKQSLPAGFDWPDLEQHAVVFRWQNGRFLWPEPHLAQLPLALETPPQSQQFVSIVHKAGELAKDAHRVEVPFEFVAPAPEDYWKGDTRSGVQVAVGRSGATKRQNLELGKGTSQHVLIAGKTGSGKSTLLHCLITNAALKYSPQELELYLIDFKKGVEFKTYAAHQLPHARVVAVESEREFGLSVMKRLDEELKIRGDKFRDLGVQDLRGYRELADTRDDLPPLPRILFVVDEFQEFFVEDDRLAQEAGQLLDRLVRQGRAFGIHVLFGSQTLGGSYSLPRSTIGQMAVRIALQCSEADAHLILSEDNTAARLLSRPGEAIYNDANGLVEGNNPFQVTWLPDSRRDHYLDQVMRLWDAHPQWPRRSQIVFEGNVPALIQRNDWLLDASKHPPLEAGRPARAWLGEAVAIKDPTAAVFHRQSGSNVLVLGQQDETALNVLAAALISLAVQHPGTTHSSGKPSREVATHPTQPDPKPSDHQQLNDDSLDEGQVTATDSRESHRAPEAPGESAAAGEPAAEVPSAEQVFLLDGTPADSPQHGKLRTLAEWLPLAVELVDRRSLEGSLGRVAAEVKRRLAADEAEAPACYLVIYDLSRFRTLRRSEDDFGFSRYDEDKAAGPDQLLAEILRDGPSVGVHTIAWCDTLANLQRTLDRSGQREFEMRVLFQMSANDSSTLIDGPQASRLGPNRALLFQEDQGVFEKFRPYAWPERAWLQQLVAGRWEGSTSGART